MKVEQIKFRGSRPLRERPVHRAGSRGTRHLLPDRPQGDPHGRSRATGPLEAAGRTHPTRQASIRHAQWSWRADRTTSSGGEAGPMELTDQQWLDVRKVAVAKAMQMTHGDVARSEDIASVVIEKLLVRDLEIQPGRLNAYVREMVKNAYLDQQAKQNAAYRGGPSLKHPMDEEIHGIAEKVAGVFKYGLMTSGPSGQGDPARTRRTPAWPPTRRSWRPCPRRRAPGPDGLRGLQPQGDRPGARVCQRRRRQDDPAAGLQATSARRSTSIRGLLLPDQPVIHRCHVHLPPTSRPYG